MLANCSTSLQQLHISNIFLIMLCLLSFGPLSSTLKQGEWVSLWLLKFHEGFLRLVYYQRGFLVGGPLAKEIRNS